MFTKNSARPLSEGMVSGADALTASMRSLGAIVVVGSRVTTAQAKIFAQGMIGALGLPASRLADAIETFKAVVKGGGKEPE